MKFVRLSLCFVASSLVIVSAVTDEEIAEVQQWMAPIVTMCSLQHGVTRNDIEAAKKNDDADSVKPCFVACVLNKTGVLNNNGYYDSKTGLRNLRRFVTDEDDMQKFEKVANICEKVNDVPVKDGAAGCDRAKMILSCAIENENELPF